MTLSYLEGVIKTETFILIYIYIYIYKINQFWTTKPCLSKPSLVSLSCSPLPTNFLQLCPVAVDTLPWSSANSLVPWAWTPCAALVLGGAVKLGPACWPSGAWQRNRPPGKLPASWLGRQHGKMMKSSSQVTSTWTTSSNCQKSMWLMQRPKKKKKKKNDQIYRQFHPSDVCLVVQIW